MPFHGEAVAAVFASKGSLGKLTGANPCIHVCGKQEEHREDGKQDVRSPTVLNNTPQ